MLANEYQQQVIQILGSYFQNGQISISFYFNTKQEAKICLAKNRLMQKELRFIRKDVNNTIKSIRSNFIARKTEVGKGIGTSLMAFAFGRGASGKMNVMKRENIRQLQIMELSPYNSIIRLIDEALIQLDKNKIGLESYMSSLG